MWQWQFLGSEMTQNSKEAHACIDTLAVLPRTTGRSRTLSRPRRFCDDLPGASMPEQEVLAPCRHLQMRGSADQECSPGHPLCRGVSGMPQTLFMTHPRLQEWVLGPQLESSVVTWMCQGHRAANAAAGSSGVLLYFPRGSGSTRTPRRWSESRGAACVCVPEITFSKSCRLHQQCTWVQCCTAPQKRPMVRMVRINKN